jgi:tetratricopeptide (TPR) repeat protein
MLEAREKELPNSYEPPARLASALSKMDKLPEALAAIERAIALSYGPRHLLYVKQKADIQARMGDHAGQVETLRQEVAGYQALAKGHAQPQALEDAKKRLAEAQHQRGA